MGYYTHFNLRILEGNPYLIEDFREKYESAKFAINENGESRDSTKWYDNEKDLRAFSKKHPTTLFELSGEGEDSGDQWKKYFKNGKMQTCRAAITFEPFNESKLQ